MNKEKSNDFIDWDVSTLSNAFMEREISPVEVTRKLLDRIRLYDGEINAYITVLEEEALAAAKQAEEAIYAGENLGKLHGIPIGLKDMIFTKGIKTTMGSGIYEDFIPDYDATVVEKLKAAGAIIIGKQNTHQFAYGTTGDRSHFGPVKNPHDLSKMIGGSSSGSAAAVAASLGYASVGTDTGGSVRIPASFGGVVGMKPTFGRVSTYGVFPLCYTLDHVGPITKTVKDNAILLNTLSGYDKKDLYSVKREQEQFTRFFHQGIKGKVIGVPCSTYYSYTDDAVQKHYVAAIEIFTSLGAKIKEVEITDMEKIAEGFWMTLSSEAYAVHEQRLLDYPDQFDEEVKDRVLTGATNKTSEYIQAQLVKHGAIRQYNEIFAKVDVLLTPTVPILPANIEERDVQVNGITIPISKILNRYTGLFNFTGFPSISIPCGISETGLPIGLQITGKFFDEANIYRFAHAFEQNNKV